MTVSNTKEYASSCQICSILHIFEESRNDKQDLGGASHFN